MRRDPASQSGVVNWPVHLENTCEGGMFVTVVFLGDDWSQEERPFEKCCGVGSVRLHYSESLIGDGHPGREDYDRDERGNRIEQTERLIFPDFYNETERAETDDPLEIEGLVYREVQRYFSTHLLAAVCLGSSGGSFWNDEKGCYWRCTKDDLTNEGKVLLDILEKTYGRQPYILTFLDT